MDGSSRKVLLQWFLMWLLLTLWAWLLDHRGRSFGTFLWRILWFLDEMPSWLLVWRQVLFLQDKIPMEDEENEWMNEWKKEKWRKNGKRKKRRRREDNPTLIPCFAQTDLILLEMETFLSPVTTEVTKKVQGPRTTTWEIPPPAPATNPANVWPLLF